VTSGTKWIRTIRSIGGILSKFSIAVLGFLAGVFSTWLVIPANSVAASMSRQQGRSIIDSSSFGHGALIDLPDSTPHFRPLEENPIFNNVRVWGQQQVLDGFECHSCLFEDAELSYSGGAFNIENARFSGTTHVVLSGSAANTVALLDLMNILSAGRAGTPIAQPLPPEKPIKKDAISKVPIGPINFTPPFIGPKG
jgi:hypothetical protein